MRVKLGLCGMAVLLLLALVACGGGAASGGGGGDQATLQSIAVRPASPGINVGEQKQFTATGTYSDNSTKDITASVTWSSSDDTVASIASGGLATGLHGGEATITAASGSVNGSATLTVTAVLQSITVTPNTPFNVGGIQQFTATGNYNDNTNQDLTKQVTWESSDIAIATINQGGKATGVHGGQVTISATSGSIVGSVTVQVNAVLQSISITPIGPAIEIDDTVTFTAIGNYNDQTQQDLTGTAAWASSDVTKASMSANVATGVDVGPVTITATSGSVIGSTALNVVETPTDELNGSYAFTLEGADTRGPQFFAGSFVASSGNITGVEDANTKDGVVQAEVTGSYTMLPDGRGMMVLNSTIHPNLTLRFVATADASSGKMMEFDGAGTIKGEFKAQSVSPLAAGNYVFVMGGSDNASTPIGQVGVFASDGGGNITDGKLDANSGGVTIVNADLTGGNYSDPDGNGRGTLTIIAGAVTQNYIYYLVDSNHLNLIQSDASPALGGIAELQNLACAPSCSEADLDGGFAFLLEHPVRRGADPTQDRDQFDTIGYLKFDGTGLITAGAQDNDHGPTRQTFTGIGGTYDVTSATFARGRLTQTIPGVLSETYTFYMVNSDKVFILYTIDGGVPLLTPAVGIGDRQTGPFDNSTLNGMYTLSGSELTGSYTEVLAQLSFDGAGAISGIVDVSDNGVLSSKVLNYRYITDVEPGSGRGEFGPPLGNQDPFTDYVIYVIDSNKAWSVGSDRPTFSPDTVGSIDLQ